MFFSHPHPHQSPLLQNQTLADALYCDEDRFDDVLGSNDPTIQDYCEIQGNPLSSFQAEHDLFWDDDEIATMIFKEKTQMPSIDFDSDGFLNIMRQEAVGWMLKVIGHFGFTVTTAVLAVNYYDRFITSFCFQREKPWMRQLAAVACLSVAAKVEEIHVPLLLDFQVEGSKYVFEAKTIQRMELLVLSTLQWRMNPVTPIDFINHIVRRFELIKNLDFDFINECECIVLSIITDSRFVRYLPSVTAAAVMKHVIQEMNFCDAPHFHDRILSALRTSKEKIDGCYGFIKGVVWGDHGRRICRKRRLERVPSSPSGVIYGYLGSDSSNESWAEAEPLAKRGRAAERLGSRCWRG